MDMRARETSSRQNHRPAPAYLGVSGLLTPRFMSGCEEFEARFFQYLREGVKKPDVEIVPYLCGWVSSFSDHRGVPGKPGFGLLGWQPITGSPDHPIPLVSCFAIKPCSGSKPSATDPLHPNSNEIKVRSGVAERTPFFESNALAGSKPAASQPLAVKPFAIKASSGLAARTPFFVKKSKTAAGRAWISRCGFSMPSTGYENLDVGFAACPEVQAEGWHATSHCVGLKQRVSKCQAIKHDVHLFNPKLTWP